MARIEVVSSTSAIYGVGGSGGVINIITKGGRDQADGLSFDSSVGVTVSLNKFTADSTMLSLAQTIGFKNDVFDTYLSGEWIKTNDYYDADGEIIAPEPAQTSNQDTVRQAYLAKLGWNIDDTQRLQASFDYFRSKQDSDYAPNYGGPGVPVLLAGQKAPVIAIKGLELDAQPLTQRKAAALNTRIMIWLAAR